MSDAEIIGIEVPDGQDSKAIVLAHIIDGAPDHSGLSGKDVLLFFNNVTQGLEHAFELACPTCLCLPLKTKDMK